MKKALFLISFLCATYCIFAQQNPGRNTRKFLLIVRNKTDMKNPNADTLKSYIQHWGIFINELTQSGKLIDGIRPSTEGRTITGSTRTLKDSAYTKNGEEISSIFVIRVTNLDEASLIALKCPIYEMNGSVEIRDVIDATN